MGHAARTAYYRPQWLIYRQFDGESMSVQSVEGCCEPDALASGCVEWCATYPSADTDGSPESWIKLARHAHSSRVARPRRGWVPRGTR